MRCLEQCEFVIKMHENDMNVICSADKILIDITRNFYYSFLNEINVMDMDAQNNFFPLILNHSFTQKK